MTQDEDSRRWKEDHFSEIKALPPKEAMGLELKPLEIPENAEVLFTPANREYAPYFARVRLKTYEDLRTLGLVPRKLGEEKVRQAIAADDAEVYEMAGRALRQSSGDCGCAKGPGHASYAHGNPFRSAYNGIRKAHNPALARTLADHYGTRINWDAAVPAIVRKWALSVHLSPEITLSLLGDVTIHRNATLSMAASLKLMMAWNVWIHTTGRLIGQGSYHKIWANSINRFNFLNLATVASAQKVAPLWTLTD